MKQSQLTSKQQQRKKLTKSRNWRNYQIRLDFDKENHVWIALSLYEHPRRPSTSETLTIFGLWSSKLEKLFLTGVFGRHFVSRTKNQRGGSFSCLNALKNKSLTLPGHFDRFKMVHVDSQIKSKMSETRDTHTSQKFNFTKRLCCEMYKNKHFDRENHGSPKPL